MRVKILSKIYLLIFIIWSCFLCIGFSYPLASAISGKTPSFGYKPYRINEHKKQAREWQVEGAKAALMDDIPEVRALALNKLNSLDLWNRLAEEQIEKIVELLDNENS